MRNKHCCDASHDQLFNLLQDERPAYVPFLISVRSVVHQLNRALALIDAARCECVRHGNCLLFAFDIQFS